MGFIDHTLAELGGDKGNAGLLDKLREHATGGGPVGAAADDDDRGSGAFDFLGRGAHSFCLGDRTPGQAGCDRCGIGFLVGNIFGKFDMGGAGLFFFGQTDCFAHAARDIVSGRQLMGEFGDRTHHIDNVENLEAALFGFLDRFLAGDHQDRHAAQLRISSGGHQIGRAGAQGCHADTGLAGVPSISRGHETGTLFVAGQYELNFLRTRQAVEHVEIFFARNAEDIFNALVFETFYEQIGCFGHVGPSLAAMTSLCASKWQRPK